MSIKEKPRPKEETFEKLLEYKIAQIKNKKYFYGSEFEETVRLLRVKPPSKFKQLRLAREVNSKIIPSLITHALLFKNKKDIEDTILAYVCLKYHIERLKLKIPKEVLANIVYGVFYLNDNEPEVWEDE